LQGAKSFCFMSPQAIMSVKCRWYQASHAMQQSEPRAVRGVVHDVAVSMGGTFSAEHGIGHVLVNELVRLRSPLELDLMRRIRGAFDPQTLLNPGKLI